MPPILFSLTAAFRRGRYIRFDGRTPEHDPYAPRISTVRSHPVHHNPPSHPHIIPNQPYRHPPFLLSCHYSFDLDRPAPLQPPSGSCRAAGGFALPPTPASLAPPFLPKSLGGATSATHFRIEFRAKVSPPPPSSPCLSMYVCASTQLSPWSS